MPSDERQTGPGAPGERLRTAVERLTRLYEREAYRVYNVALRIAGDPGAAERVTEQAFLEQSRRGDELVAAAEGSTPPTLLAATVRSALGAPRRRRAAASADAEATAMLEATAKLKPPERAALALTTLTGAGAAEVATALGIAPEGAAQLLERARAALAEKLHTAPGSLEGRLAAWPWADPPQELWESVYRSSYRELDLWARGNQAAAAASAARPSRRRVANRAPRTRRPRGERRKLSLWPRGPRRWLFRGAMLCVLLAGVAAVALTGSADDPGETASATTFASDPYSTDPAAGGESEDGESEDGEEPYEALTPEELDKLRLQELDDLERYARQQADESLSAEQRAAAEARARELIAAAQKRQSGSSGRSGSGGGSRSGSGGGGSRGGSNGFARPPKQIGGSGGGGSGGGSGGGTSGGGGTSSGSDSSGGGGDVQVITGDGKKDGGKKKDDGRKKKGGDGPTLDDCIRDTSTGQYVCPERDERQASERQTSETLAGDEG